ncbi:alpha/beta-hydrolase [Cristinia sonorae]|uniref:Alpha/beta-hydrolase n=1 Tax=Cristinia sonorae TaxID=1940300 RepID=A0A8K0UXG1_9AGAR|nr:alpha/beta-hydrolase [Cristinia sonorae]
MSLCKHCIAGVRWEGTAEGTTENIGGIECYVATPTVEYPKNKAVLFLTDVYGPNLINTQLLADDYAKNGFKTIVPDLFDGDAIPLGALQTKDFDAQGWFARHSVATARPIVDKVLAALKEAGVTTIATSGYCYGARLCFDLAFEGISVATALAHPSFLQVPEDFEKYKQTNAPLLINTCTIDPQFPLESQQKADEVLGGGQFAPGYRRAHWEGCTHGFAVRGSMDDPMTKAGKEGAFKTTVEFLMKHL